MINESEMCSNCKFDFGRFYADGDEAIFAVNKNLFTKQQADELFVSENDLPLERARTYTGYVFYGKGRNPIECWAYVW